MENKKLKLVKYGHQYCGPCNFMKPVLEKVVQSTKDVLDFVDVNTLELSPDKLEEAKKLGINAVPTMILYKDGQEIWRHVGVKNGDEIIAIVAQYAN